MSHVWFHLVLQVVVYDVFKLLWVVIVSKPIQVDIIVLKLFKHDVQASPLISIYTNSVSLLVRSLA